MTGGQRMEKRKTGTKEIDKKSGKGLRYAAKACVSALFLVLCLLSGCALAKPELQEIQGEQEELLGVLVTVGDQEAERLHQEELENRTYSSIRELEESFSAPPTVEGTLQDETYVFPGVEGYLLGVFPDGEDQGKYYKAGEPFTDVHMNANVTDEGEYDRIEAKLLVQMGMEKPIYVNPVYGRADGSVYVQLDSGGWLTSGSQTEGEMYGITHSFESSEKVNGEEKKSGREFYVAIEVSNPAETVSILEMNGEHEILAVHETFAEDGESIPLQEETAYVIVEETGKDDRVERSLYDWDEEQAKGEGISHAVYEPGENGILIPRVISFTK